MSETRNSFEENRTPNYDEDFTPYVQLVKAVENNDFDNVKLLIQNGAFVMPASPWDTCFLKGSPLTIAARNGNLEILQYLAQQKYADVNAPDCQGCTPLHMGVKHYEIVKFLIDQKVYIDPHITDTRYTPLHLAVLGKNWDVAKLLFDYGASPESCALVRIEYGKPVYGETIYQLLEGHVEPSDRFFETYRKEHINKELAHYMRTNQNHERFYKNREYKNERFEHGYISPYEMSPSTRHR